MSAEALRLAADRLEALTAAAQPHPSIRWLAADELADALSDNEDAVYIATMHPGVGKALAAWLRLQAEVERRLGGPDYETPPAHPALAVARAILERADA